MRAGAVAQAARAWAPATSCRQSRDHAAKRRPRTPESAGTGRGEREESVRHAPEPRPTRSSSRDARRSLQLLAACPRSLVGEVGRHADVADAFRCPHGSPMPCSTAYGSAAGDGSDDEWTFGVYMTGGSEVAPRPKYWNGRVESLLHAEWCPGISARPSRANENIAIWRCTFVPPR
jgi:hypothetical protein